MNPNNPNNRNPYTDPLNALINKVLVYMFVVAIIVTVVGVVAAPVVLATKISLYWLFAYPVYLVVVAMVALAFKKGGKP